jgi:hypothetical protein
MIQFSLLAKEQQLEVAFGMCVVSGHWLYRRCDAGPRAHEWNNPLLHSRSHRPASGACVAVHLRSGWRQSRCRVSVEVGLGLSPVAVANLAAAGSDLRRVTRQIELAHDLRPQIMLISGGINDLINYEAPLDEIRYDFALLLRRLGKEQKSVVTLIPYISDRNFTNRITAANNVIAELSLQRGIPVVDINPSLSVDGVRRPEMTTDGIHLSALACRMTLARSLDHFVRGHLHDQWDCDVESLGGLEVDDQLELHRLGHGYVSGLCAF